MNMQIPCRTAMRGSFPLNGTYFQVNEVSIVNNSIIYIRHAFQNIKSSNKLLYASLIKITVS